MATIVQIANADRNLTYFSRGLKQTGFDEKLSEMGPFTLLSPVNFAFGNLGSISLDDLFLPVNAAKLIDVIGSHIIQGKNMIKDFRNGRKLTTINGKELTVDLRNGEIHINNATVLSRDRQAKNGVVHSVNNMCLDVV